MRLWTRSLVLTSLVLTGTLALARSARAELPELLLTIPSDSHHIVFGYGILPLGDQNGDGCAGRCYVRLVTIARAVVCISTMDVG